MLVRLASLASLARVRPLITHQADQLAAPLPAWGVWEEEGRGSHSVRTPPHHTDGGNRKWGAFSAGSSGKLVSYILTPLARKELFETERERVEMGGGAELSLEIILVSLPKIVLILMTLQERLSSSPLLYKMIVSLTSNSSHEIYFCMTFDLTMRNTAP